MTELNIGSLVPDFEAPATGDKTFKLSTLRGKNIVLYFYPKDNTPGCIKEGQDFRDNYSQFEELNTLIVGVSRDSIKVHENFKSKQLFPFDLLSDTEEQLCQLFDVIKMKNMYGRKVRGIERSTFLIDTDGRLVQKWRKVKVNTHIEEVLHAIRELGL